MSVRWALRPLAAAWAWLALAQAAMAAGFPGRELAAKPEAWYRTDEAARLAANVLSHRSPLGDWPKNFDTSAEPFRGDASKIRGTFDNGATVGEVRFLARAYVARGSKDDRYRGAVVEALDQILAAQYPSGGSPQSAPPGTGYARYITFNDNTTVNLLELLRDASRAPDFAWLDAPRREAARRAFARGIACIVKCQVLVDGVPTVWCAQHDERTLEPRGARAFELPGLSGSESAGILLLLMSLDDPGPEVVRAVDAGARWFESAKLSGLRQETIGGDKRIIADPAAPPLWARFYEIDTNRPFFCGRDGVKKYRLGAIEAERRNGYAWYGAWGAKVAARYASWKKGAARPS